MRNKEKDEAQMAEKRNHFLAKSYELFTKKSIESVSMIEVAKECGYGTTTLYRYYSTKPELVVAVATWKWDQFINESKSYKQSKKLNDVNAAGLFEYYLDFFLAMYQKHSDLLRFNQFFNMYIQAEGIGAEVMKPYRDMIDRQKARFHIIYEKALQDHTIRTDESEDEIFNTTLHLMLAAVTRYAVGLVYTPDHGFDAMRELEKLKEALLLRYKT